MANWHLFIRDYSWFLLKNILGWVLILASLVLGPAIPGPGGIPIFLIGFALITFPGKRRLTARVMRGQVLRPVSRRYRTLSWLISCVLPAILVWTLGEQSGVEGWIYRHNWQPSKARVVSYLALALSLFFILRVTPLLINVLLRLVPRIRRKVRPALRRMGIHLLPPRSHRHSKGKGKGHQIIQRAEEEIIIFTDVWRRNMSKFWKTIRPWLPKLIGAIVVPVIFYRLFKPIADHWDQIAPHLTAIRWDLFALACVMFAINQGLCRVMSWRGVLCGLGWRMPAAGSARVWASSELARYVPGLVWQVVGRAFLAKPYGLPMTTCSISQILEITMYLLANVIVAAGTLSLISSQIADEHTRRALQFATILVPVLLAFLHPRVFYPTVNFILRKLKRPLIERQLSAPRMLGLLLLGIAGQAWLGLAIWITTFSILHIELRDAWMLAGSYCLAWAAGFCMASIAPSGAGIREAVLSGTLVLIVGNRIGVDLDPAGRAAIFAAIALLLRLWATVGEMLFAAAAYLWDFKAARGQVVEYAQPTES